jgi:plasmid replication initiation protein
MQNKDNHLVTKDNNLIEAKYRLSVQEQRLMAIMVSDIKPDDKDFKPYKYRVKDFIEWTGVQGKDYYRELRKITAKLLTRIITIKEDNRLIQTSWLSSAVYDYKKGTIELLFDPHLKPYLLQLKNCFTQYALQNVLELKSKYAFRLYELCKQYQSMGKRKFQIDELRELLGLEKNELKRWSDFKGKVLEIAQREINKHTDLKIKYEFEKWGRKFEYITIFISANTEKEIEKQKDERYDKLINLIKDEKDKKKKTIQSAIIKYLKQKGFEYVKRNIEYANEKAEKNYRNFLIQSLKNDWAMSWIEDIEEEKEKAKELQEKQMKLEKYQEKIKRLKASARKRAEEITQSWSKEEYNKKYEEIKHKIGGIIKDEELIREAIIFEEMKRIIDEAVKIGKLKESIAKEIIRIY